MPRRNQAIKQVLRGLAAVMALGVLGWTAARLWTLGINSVKVWRFEIDMALSRLGSAERCVLVGGIAVVVAMFLLSRTAKS